MKDIKLDKKFCLNFCPYYKPSKGKELACMGFIVIERLIENGKEIPFDRYNVPAQASQMIDAVTEEALIQNMCMVCSFYEGDCDFILHKWQSRPCGGFTFLGHLLKAHIVVVDDIINANYNFK